MWLEAEPCCSDSSRGARECVSQGAMETMILPLLSRSMKGTRTRMDRATCDFNRQFNDSRANQFDRQQCQTIRNDHATTRLPYRGANQLGGNTLENIALWEERRCQKTIRPIHQKWPYRLFCLTFLLPTTCAIFSVHVTAFLFLVLLTRVRCGRLHSEYGH